MTLLECCCSHARFFIFCISDIRLNETSTVVIDVRADMSWSIRSCLVFELDKALNKVFTHFESVEDGYTNRPVKA